MSQRDKALGVKINLSGILTGLLTTAIISVGGCINTKIDALTSQSATQSAETKALRERLEALDRHDDEFQRQLNELAVWCGKNPSHHEDQYGPKRGQP